MEGNPWETPESWHDKYAMDEFIHRLQAVKADVLGAKVIYEGQYPGLLQDLDNVQYSIEGLIDGIQKYDASSIDEFNNYIEQKHRNLHQPDLEM